jgi:hypothetical protein
MKVQLPFCFVHAAGNPSGNTGFMPQAKPGATQVLMRSLSFV